MLTAPARAEPLVSGVGVLVFDVFQPNFKFMVERSDGQSRDEAEWTDMNGNRVRRSATVQSFPEPLRITPRNARRVQHNCVACHRDLVGDVLTAGGAAHGKELDCVHCHAGVGHGETTGLGGPERRDEIEAAERAAATASQGTKT